MEVYFDNSSTTKPYDEVINVVAATMKNYYGNPSSAHTLGFRAEKIMNEAREAIAKTLSCNPEETIFTSGGSESNNFLIRAFVKSGGHIITSKIEHPSVLETCRELEGEGISVTYLNVDSRGKISLEELSNSINKNTQLVTIMHVNNEMGIIQDIESIGRIVKENSSRAKFHVDAVQSYCKNLIDVKKCNIDLLSSSAHKIHGPRGVGAAYVKKGLIPRPLIAGGGQERSFRSGTENLPAICGMAEAAKIMYNNMGENYKKVFDVKKHFIDNLEEIPDMKVNSPLDENFSPYILSISFRGVRGETLLHGLEDKGIYVSTGSACSARKSSESHVLKALGLCASELDGTLRFSFSEENTKGEVDYVLENLKKILDFLRRVKK